MIVCTANLAIWRNCVFLCSNACCLFLIVDLDYGGEQICHDHAVFFSCQSFGHCFCWQRALFQTCDQQQSNREIQNSCRNSY